MATFLFLCLHLANIQVSVCRTIGPLVCESRQMSNKPSWCFTNRKHIYLLHVLAKRILISYRFTQTNPHSATFINHTMYCASICRKQTYLCSFERDKYVYPKNGIFSRRCYFCIFYLFILLFQYCVDNTLLI